jgi:hypothetical protein
MTRKNLYAFSSSLIAIMALQACGGSSSPAVTPPAAVVPPPAAATIGKTVIGPISGFGSVIVNGVRYDTSAATFTIDGSPGTQSDLKVGQIIVLKSEQDSSGTYVASSVDYEEILEGPVSSIDRSNGSFVILGRTVLIDKSTSFDDDISPSSINGLVIDDILEISGEFNAAGDILATRIDKSDDQSLNNDYEIHGVVSNLDTAAMTFNLGTLQVGYASAQLEDFGNTSIANGDYVEVEGTNFLNDGSLIATKVENENDDEDDREGKEDDEAELRGLITTFDSAQRFTIAGVTIITNNSTRYEDGTSATLGLDVRVEVEGTYNAAGELIAREIEFESRSQIEVSSKIEAIDTANNTLTVFGLDFTVDEMTRYEDNESGGSQTFSISNLMVNDYIEISAYEDNTGALIASKIEREDDDEDDDDDNDGNGDETEIEAPVSQVGSNSLTLLGITVQTNSSTRYEINDDENVSAATFFARVKVGDIVEAEGTSAGAATLLAEELSLENSDD